MSPGELLIIRRHDVIAANVEAGAHQAGASVQGNGCSEWRVQGDLAQRLPRQIRRLLLLSDGLVSHAVQCCIKDAALGMGMSRTHVTKAITSCL